MKIIIGITITLSIILTGCSSAKSGVVNESKPAVNDTTINNAPLNNNQQSESEKTIDNVRNTNTNIIKNIDTAKSLFEKGYYDYQGTINNIPIQMSIYPLDKDIVGTYFYEKQRKEIKLRGKAGGKDIILYEYDKTGKNTGVFQGKMNTVDKIIGTWISADGKRSLPFSLSLKSNIPGANYGKRYAVAVNKSDQDVENFASKIQSYIINDNKEQLAKEVQYPINVKINGKVTKIQNSTDFIKNYDQIFNLSYKNAISNAFTKYLFVNWQGIMFGEGLYNIWINEETPPGSTSKLMITAINN